MPLKPVGGEITSQAINDSLAYLDSEKLGKGDLPFLNVRDFGAACDGTTNDSAAIQAAIDSLTGSGEVLIPRTIKGTLIGNTVKVPDNVSIIGNNTRLLSKLVFPASGGSHPTCIFENSDPINGNKNIRLEGLILDGQFDKGTWVDGAKAEQDNLIRFKNVTGLWLTDVELTNIRNNKDSSVTTPPDTFYTGFFDRCSDVQMVNLKLNKVFNTEGIRFIHCNKVHLEKFTSYNEQCWTPLHAYYCDGFTVKDAVINEDVGRPWDASVINLFSKNVLFDNCSIKGGKAIDLGNEQGEPFVSENVMFQECNIETTMGFDTAGQDTAIVKNLSFLNNVIRTKERAFSFFGYSGYDVLIKENDIEVIEGNHAAIYIDLRGGSFYKNLKIIDNAIKNAQTGIYLYHRGGLGFDGVTIENNEIHCSPLGLKPSLEGNATGIHIYFYDTEVSPGAYFKNITINENSINAEGGYITSRYINLGSAAFDNKEVKITENLGYSTGASCGRGIQMYGIKRPIIKGNRILDLAGINVLGYCSDIQLKDNLIVHKDITGSTASWRIDNGSGVIVAKTNIRKGTISSNHFYTQGGGNSFSDKIITENIPNTVDAGI